MSSQLITSMFVRRCVRHVISLVCLMAPFALVGCDQLGIETPKKAAERQLEESKAVGGACRQAMRAIEDCYTLNPKADKTGMYEGWREMDEYMRENKLEGIKPVIPVPPPSQPAAKKRKSSEDDASSDDSADDTTDDTSGSADKKGH